METRYIYFVLSSWLGYAVKIPRVGAFIFCVPGAGLRSLNLLSRCPNLLCLPSWALFIWTTLWCGTGTARMASPVGTWDMGPFPRRKATNGALRALNPAGPLRVRGRCRQIVAIRILACPVCFCFFAVVSLFCFHLGLLGDSDP